MSRVFSALTGAPRPAGAVTLDLPDDGVWENSADGAAEADCATDAAPFIEIGGPGGPVFSGIAPPPTVRLAPTTKIETKIETKTESKVESKPEPARSFPRLAPAPIPANATAHLTVRFHDVGLRGPKSNVIGPDASLVAFHLPEHPASAEYLTLRNEIIKQLPGTTSHALLFASAAAEAGTTTVLMNLAVTLAREEKTRVLIVDGNVARPAVAGKLGLKPGPGVCEVLSHTVPLTWAVQPSAVGNLDVLAAGETVEGTPAAIGREFARLLGQVRQWYDWVLVDGGVWGKLPERDAVCPSVDAVYLVSRDSDTERPEFLAARGWVKELGGSLRGYVTTKV